MDDWTRRAQAFWDAQAAADPLWAVLTYPDRKARQWRLDEFMRNGEREVALLFHELERLGFGRRFASALDFGCGVGRVTQALARRCDSVLGIDISPRMVAIAEALNAYPGAVRYVSLDLDGVRHMASGTFDLIYSNIVLQHIEPERTLEYLGELSRLLRPHGALVFQLPSHRRQSSDPLIRPMPDGAYRAELRVLDQAPTIAEYEVPHYSLAALDPLLGASGAGNDGAFPMYGVPQEQVLELIRGRGGLLVRVEDGNRAGPEWIDYRYFVRAL